MRTLFFFFVLMSFGSFAQPGVKAVEKERPEDRLYEFTQDGRYGFKNYDGKVMIPATYKRIRNFLEGYAAVMDDNERWGLIDKKGKYVLPFKYTFLRSPSEGLICFSLNDTIGYMDLKGNVKIRPQYRTGFEFMDGIAPVENLASKWGYIDKEGKIAVAFIFDEIIPFFEGGASVRIGSKWGEVDRKGAIIIEPK